MRVLNAIKATLVVGSLCVVAQAWAVPYRADSTSFTEYVDSSTQVYSSRHGGSRTGSEFVVGGKRSASLTVAQAVSAPVLLAPPVADQQNFGQTVAPLFDRPMLTKPSVDAAVLDTPVDTGAPTQVVSQDGLPTPTAVVAAVVAQIPLAVTLPTNPAGIPSGIPTPGIFAPLVQVPEPGALALLGLGGLLLLRRRRSH